MRQYVVVAATALLLSLTACSEDAPKASPAPTSPTTSASPSAPALPLAAQGKGPKAAEAFVRHYVDLINYGLRTLDERASEATGR